MESDVWGRMEDGRVVRRYELDNGKGLKAAVTDFGATLAGVETPDRSGRMADVILGYDACEGWFSNPSYIGSTIGRYANRISKGRFVLEGATCSLACNNGPNHLHGGQEGFDKKLWTGTPQEGVEGVRFSRISPDGEEGYPGNLQTSVTYLLTAENELGILFEATTDRTTIVNLCNHAYWNLSGDPSRPVTNHLLRIDSDAYLPVDGTSIPTGERRPVEGTPFDFRTLMPVGSRIDAEDEQFRVGNGYDHYYLLGPGRGLRRAAKVMEPESGRTMEVLTDQPGMQFYTANHLNGGEIGKGGVPFQRRCAFCLETQLPPDSPNQPGFPSPVLRPGETYRHQIVFRFGVAE